MTTLTTVRGDDAGFSVVELLVAAGLVALLAAAMLALAAPARDAAFAQPEAIDVQQRARFAATSLYRDLHVAGAGSDSGPFAGPLGAYFPPVLPRRLGALSPDSAATARPDVVSIIRTTQGAAHATLLVPFSTSVMLVRDEPGCPAGRPACGIPTGAGVLLFDPAGHFDLFTVLSVSGPAVSVRARGPGPARVYQDGAFVAEAVATTFYRDAATQQLRQYNTDSTDVPVMDGVAGMAVEYYGSTSPPSAPRPPAGQANCLYSASGAPVAGLPTLPVEDAGLAGLPLEIFRDGPWCGAGSTAYDADLLRVRRVRVTLRVQASSAAMRALGDRFAEPGTSHSVWRTVPDVALTFDVAPRNLDLVRR
jgi:type II secretory pathway pseudopilin PulG